MRQHRGTLVCVVLKGKHLVLKRVQDSQDPVAEVCVDGVRLRTLPDRRAGTSPLWDEQMHFEIYEDDDSDIDEANEHDERVKKEETPKTLHQRIRARGELRKEDIAELVRT